MNTHNWRHAAVTNATDPTGNTSRRPRASKPVSYLLAFGAVFLLTTAYDNPAQTQDPTLNEELTALQAQVGDFESQVTQQTQALQSARQRVGELEAQLAKQKQQVAQANTVVQERDQFRQQLAGQQAALQKAQARIQTLQQRRELTLEERSRATLCDNLLSEGVSRAETDTYIDRVSQSCVLLSVKADDMTEQATVVMNRYADENTVKVYPTTAKATESENEQTSEHQLAAQKTAASEQGHTTQGSFKGLQTGARQNALILSGVLVVRGSLCLGHIGCGSRHL